MDMMDIMVIVFAVVFTSGMFYYTYMMYKKKSLSPENVIALKDEVYQAMVDGGMKELYRKLDDVSLMDAYLTIKKTPVKKGQIARQIEIASKMEIIAEIFEERGITPKQ
ncbi:MAG: hypothetical protein PF505_10440 [Vallitaleaceae bacterium]|jgi:hypothetical protein|nr:hypothetical protein [Vallitaleaceae bacterium]